MSKISKTEINKQVRIINIAEEFGIKLEQISTNKFDYRCRCPSVNHKGGGERTASLYINSKNNDFYCYGCQANNSVIDFYMLVNNMDFSSASRELMKRVDQSLILDKLDEHESLIQPNIFSILLEISFFFRKMILENPDDLIWINNVMKQTDKYINEIDSKGVDEAKALLSQIKLEFKNRKSS